MRKIGPNPKYGIQLPKGKPYQIPTPPDQIKLHCLMLVIGKRGAGKTVAITSHMHSLVRDRALDRLFVMSPTWESNRNAFIGLPVEEQDVFHEATVENLEEILKRVKQEAKDLNEYTEKMSTKRRMEAALKEMASDADVDNVDPQLLMMAESYGILDGEEPFHRWGGKRPVLGLFIDDSVGCKMFGSREFVNFCLRHRHVGPIKETAGLAPSGLGLSVWMASQAYTTQQGGIPKAVRGEHIRI